jgi:hypothetical protein
MPKARASIFEEEEREEGQGLDVGSFAPKTAIDPKAPKQEEVRAVAKAARFPSREAATAEPSRQPKRAPRIYRTGRNVQFNAKVSQETADAIYAITDANDKWVIGYTLERAITALRRELELEKASNSRSNAD